MPPRGRNTRVRYGSCPVTAGHDGDRRGSEGAADPQAGRGSRPGSGASPPPPREAGPAGEGARGPHGRCVRRPARARAAGRAHLRTGHVRGGGRAGRRTALRPGAGPRAAARRAVGPRRRALGARRRSVRGPARPLLYAPGGATDRTSVVHGAGGGGTGPRGGADAGAGGGRTRPGRSAPGRGGPRLRAAVRGVRGDGQRPGGAVRADAGAVGGRVAAGDGLHQPLGQRLRGRRRARSGAAGPGLDRDRAGPRRVGPAAAARPGRFRQEHAGAVAGAERRAADVRRRAGGLEPVRPLRPAPARLHGPRRPARSGGLPARGRCPAARFGPGRAGRTDCSSRAGRWSSWTGSTKFRTGCASARNAG